MRTFRFFFLLFSAVQAVTGQAPGDEDSSCLQHSPIIPAPVNMEILMSSFKYNNLLGISGPWITLPSNSVSDIHYIYNC